MYIFVLYTNCTFFSLKFGIIILSNGRIDVRAALRSAMMYMTLNFETFVLFVDFVRSRCFELVKKRVLSVCEANFIIKYVILGRPRYGLSYFNLVVGSLEKHYKQMTNFDLLFETNSTRIVVSQPRRKTRRYVLLIFVLCTCFSLNIRVISRSP